MISQLSHRLFYVSNTVGPMSNRGALKNLKANPLDRQSILLHWMTDLTLVIEARNWSRQPMHTSVANRESNEEKRRRLTDGQAACESDAVASTSKK